jgi:PAS domain S-box-containing protein
LCEFFNQGWLDFTGRSLDQELGVGWAEGVHAEDLQRCMHTYFDALVARRPFAMEYRLRRHDGEYRWIYDQGAPRYEPDSTFAGYIGSCVDVTDQRQARDALKRLAGELEARVEERTQLAREREVLLREVHHRVKNDLQLISSILNMQRRQLADAKALVALQDTDARVQTIALIHEHMYSSNNLARLSFSHNVRSMAAGLFRLADAEARTVSLEMDIEEGIWLPVDRAIPCGLILNELLRNALKHAFPGDRPGKVRVGLARGNEDDTVILTVADDGVGGLLEQSTGNGGSFGWQLVDAFVRQLGAQLRVDQKAGLSVSVVLAAQNGIEERRRVHDLRAGC